MVCEILSTSPPSDRKFDESVLRPSKAGGSDVDMVWLGLVRSLKSFTGLHCPDPSRIAPDEVFVGDRRVSLGPAEALRLDFGHRHFANMSVATERCPQRLPRCCQRSWQPYGYLPLLNNICAAAAAGAASIELEESAPFLVTAISPTS